MGRSWLSYMGRYSCQTLLYFILEYHQRTIMERNSCWLITYIRHFFNNRTSPYHSSPNLISTNIILFFHNLSCQICFLCVIFACVFFSVLFSKNTFRADKTQSSRNPETNQKNPNSIRIPIHRINLTIHRRHHHPEITITLPFPPFPSLNTQ